MITPTAVNVNVIMINENNTRYISYPLHFGVQNYNKITYDDKICCRYEYKEVNDDI